MDARSERQTLAGLAANDNGDELANRRFEMRLANGFAAFGNRCTSTPEAGVGISNGSRDYSVGCQLGLSGNGPRGAEFALQARRHEATGDYAAGAEAGHAIGLRATGRW